jgi:hypothetical protein
VFPKNCAEMHANAATILCRVQNSPQDAQGNFPTIYGANVPLTGSSLIDCRGNKPPSISTFTTGDIVAVWKFGNGSNQDL